MRICWAIITGEYPPQPGGVSDYTRLVARGLAEAGDEVHVWSPVLRPSAGELPDGGSNDAAVIVHRLPDHFGPAGLVALGRELRRLRSPCRILVQYVPHAFGLKAMNVPFCVWTLTRRPAEVWTMFHEVAFPFVHSPIKHNLLAVVHRLMAWLMTRASAAVLVSTPAWEKMLSRLAPGRRIQWLPVPSNLPTEVDRVEVAALRAVLNPSGQPIVGYFGSYGGAILGQLESLLPLLLDDPGRVGLLLGRGGETFARQFAAGHPRLRSRALAPGQLPPQAAATHLAACDVLVLPFPDGASCRRGSLMAGLALGVPIVTTDGPSTEPLLRESGALAMVARDDPAAMLRVVQGLLGDEGRRRDLSERGRALYRMHFSIDHTLAVLRHDGRSQARPTGEALP